jgi:hypothetical protein
MDGGIVYNATTPDELFYCHSAGLGLGCLVVGCAGRAHMQDVALVGWAGRMCAYHLLPQSKVADQSSITVIYSSFVSFRQLHIIYRKSGTAQPKYLGAQSAQGWQCTSLLHVVCAGY